MDLKMETDNNVVGSVRLATENDVEKIAKVEQRCFSEPWSENAFRSCLTDDTDLFVLEVNGVICGFAVFDRTLGIEAELQNIAVAPEVRGLRLSRLLMDAIIASARKNGVERIMLEVRASNEAALSLYTKYNFEKVGLRPGYYRHPTENAILMDLILDKAELSTGGEAVD